MKDPVENQIKELFDSIEPPKDTGSRMYRHIQEKAVLLASNAPKKAPRRKAHASRPASTLNLIKGIAAAAFLLFSIIITSINIRQEHSREEISKSGSVSASTATTVSLSEDLSEETAQESIGFSGDGDGSTTAYGIAGDGNIPQVEPDGGIPDEKTGGKSGCNANNESGGKSDTSADNEPDSKSGDNANNGADGKADDNSTKVSSAENPLSGTEAPEWLQTEQADIITDSEAKYYFQTYSAGLQSTLNACGVPVQNMHISEHGYSHVNVDPARNQAEVRQNFRDYLVYDGDTLIAIVTLYKENDTIYSTPMFGSPAFEGYNEYLQNHKGESLLFLYYGMTEVILAPDGSCYNSMGLDVSSLFENIEHPYELYYHPDAVYEP